MDKNNRCRNCNLHCHDKLCRLCEDRQCCQRCRRFLPDHCYEKDTDDVCAACTTRHATTSHIRRRGALDNTTIEVDFEVNEGNNSSFEQLFDNLRHSIVASVRQQLDLHSSTRLQFVVHATFQRSTVNEWGTEDVSSITAYFHSPSFVVTESTPIDLRAVVQYFNSRADGFSRRGSGYTLAWIDSLTANFVKFRPLGAGSYYTTPTWIKRKHAVVNVINKNDNKCFIWSVLAHLHPATSHPYRLSNYAKYENTLNTTGLQFPLPVNEIPKFEKLNPTIAIHCIAADENQKSFAILHLSPEAHTRPHVVTLLLLDDKDNPQNRHYVYVKNLSRLLGQRVKHTGKSYVCLSCLQVFQTERVLKQHERCCLIHKPQQITYPDPSKPEQCTLSFTRRQYQHPHDFYYVCDFESYLVPLSSDGTSSTSTAGHSVDVNRHETSGFCLHRLTPHEKYKTSPYCYSGPGAIEKFFDKILEEAKIVDEIMSADVPMAPMTDAEILSHEVATSCAICKQPFDSRLVSQRHHNHVSGKYLFAACQNCNLALKPRTCNDGHEVVCLFHNLKSYDSHFLLKHFKREYTESVSTQTGKIHYDDIKAIPMNAEKNLQFRIRNVVFSDSYEFLGGSLDTLVQTLKKDGKGKFVETRKYLGDEDFLLEKGHFCYDYFDSLQKLEEPCLPLKSAFFNSMTQTSILDADYEQAQRVWQHYGMTKFSHYHDHYLQRDVLLLADCIESFRQAMLSEHGIDCLHFPSLPSMVFQLALKMTGVKLDLITDANMFNMIESGIRGGLSFVSHRHAKANNPSLPDYKPEEPTTHLSYVDANSLYATCQMMPLPVGDFRFLSQAEIDSFDVMQICEDSPVGYVLEVDLVYPPELHDLHNAYPLCPEHMTVTEDMLSGTHVKMLEFMGASHADNDKLVTNLKDRNFYVTHHRCLQFYLSHDMRLTRIHRIVSFHQEAFMQPFVEYCNRQRQVASTEFESGFYKLLPNTFYGKCTENKRKRVNLKLVTDPTKLVRAASKATFKKSTIINEDLVLVENQRQKILMDRPLIIGFTILEYAKLVMYRFYYDALLPKYGASLKLCFTDTDSFIFLVETPDLHADMAGMMEWYDTSNFPTDHPLYSLANKRRLGFFKSETSAYCPSEFCGIRSKMYSLSTPTSDDPSHTFVKAKGVPKTYVKKNVRHEQYLHVLNNWSTTTCKFRAFRSNKHVVTTRQLEKVCLSCIDDKRWIREDGISSYAYGHKDIPGRPLGGGRAVGPPAPTPHPGEDEGEMD